MPSAIERSPAHVQRVAGGDERYDLVALFDERHELGAVSHDSLGVAIVFVVLGVVIGGLAIVGRISNLPPGVSQVAGFTRRQPLAWMLGAALGLAGLSNVATSSQRASERAARCTRAQSDATTAVARNDFGSARSALNTAKVECPSDKDAEIATALADVNAKDAAYRKAQAEQATAQQAAAAAANEKSAVDGFPALSKQVNDFLRAAAAKMGQGQWNDAEDIRGQARGALDADQGTSVASTKAWSDLSARVDALEQKLQPQLARVAQQQAARAQQQAVAEEQGMLNSILSEYKDNEVRADSEYKGKTVEFSGIASAIAKDITDNIYITVGHGEWLEMPEIQCFFDDNLARQAAQITKGQRVRLRGRVQGKMMNVLIKDCEFIN